MERSVDSQAVTILTTACWQCGPAQLEPRKHVTRC